MADEVSIAQIDTFVTNHNGDVTLRCGSLNANQADADRLWGMEVDTSNMALVAEGVTLADCVDSMAQQIGALGGN